MSTSRRTFIAGGGSLLLAGAAQALPAVPRHVSREADDDCVLRGGSILDGSGQPARIADLAIRDGRIAAIGVNLPRSGGDEIDVRGLTVAPGFIDIHSHGDGTLAADPRAESVIRQGITTIVVGADGSSRASGGARDDFASLFARIDRLRAAPNVASLIGLGTVRGVVVGSADRRVSASELRTMVAMVERAIAQGACGASSGLEYTPGAFASQDELIALCRPLSSRGLLYATHMRNEDDRLLDAIDESIAVARGAGCALQISHLKTQGPRNWDKLQPAFDRIAAARADGIDVAFDRYPYLAYATTLVNLFPVWSRDGGTAALLRRLADASVSARIEAETRAKVALIGSWDNVLVTRVSSAADRDAEGKRLGAWATGMNREPYAVLVALMQRNGGSVDMAGFAMSEENLERILAHPLGMVCTDGGAFAIDGPTRRGSPHPRGAGSFPRVLGRYVRERCVMTLPEAIRRMTSLPAARLRLRDRGRLAVGMAADVVAFDPATVSDTATFEKPFSYPVGIRLVIVNGQVTLRDGVRSRTHAGRALRASGR
ncbi:MAG TPA: amidohydrolase family protein [Gemmatimonadaceae bacterium]|nr:amidohydrolase family protein [Gemmatimonadaceae bacterium]